MTLLYMLSVTFAGALAGLVGGVALAAIVCTITRLLSPAGW